MKKFITIFIPVILLLAVSLIPISALHAQDTQIISGAKQLTVKHADVSAPLRDMIITAASRQKDTVENYNVPNKFKKEARSYNSSFEGKDPIIQSNVNSARANSLPEVYQSFDGGSQADNGILGLSSTPPDTQGDGGSPVLSISTVGVSEGDYSGSIDITTNDPSNVLDQIPVELRVNSEDIGGQKLYVFNGINPASIIKADLDGQNANQPFVGLGRPIDGAVDVVNRKLYYSDISPDYSIYRTDLDGANKEKIYTGAAVYSIGLDVVNNHMYFVTQDASLGWSISRANLDGSNIVSLANNISSNGISGLNIVPSQGKIYWAQRGTGPSYSQNGIWRANLDLTGQEKLTSGAVSATSLNLDVANYEMYWYELRNVGGTNYIGVIRKATMDGLNGVDILNVPAGDVALDPVGGKVYWTEQGGSYPNLTYDTYRANLDGTNTEALGLWGWRLAIDTSPAVISNCTVSIDAQPQSQEVCVGTTGLDFTVQASGNGTLSYSWELSADGGATFFDVSATSDGNPTLTLAGPLSTAASGNQYRVVVTNDNGTPGDTGDDCSVTSDVSTLTVNALPTVTADASATTICLGDQVTFYGGGATTYTWDNGVTDNVAFTPTETKTYTVTGTDANGCTNTATIEVIVNPLAITCPANITVDNIVGECGADITLALPTVSDNCLGVTITNDAPPVIASFMDAFVPAASGGLSFPGQSVFGPDGNLYVTSRLSDEILRYNGTTGAFIDAFVTTNSGGLDGPKALVYGPDGNLYVNSENSDQVLRYNGATGAFIDVFVTANSGGLDGPITLVFGPDGNLYVSSGYSDEVLRYNGATGTFMDVFVTANSGGLDVPYASVFGPDGHLYVSSLYTHEVLRYNGATGVFIDAFVSAGSGGLVAPKQLVYGPDGNMYVCSELSKVFRYDGATGAFIDEFVPAGSGGLFVPDGLVFGPDGNLYVSSSNSHEVLRYNLGYSFPIGSTNVTWTATDASGNSSSCVQIVTVNETNVLANAGTDGTLTLCEGTIPTETELFDALTGADTGGVWSGPVAGVYTYTVAPIPPCTESDTAIVTITEDPLPALTFTALDDLCLDAGIQAGLGGATPTGGVYSGPGVTDNGDGMTYSFDPSVAGAGMHDITYIYTPTPTNDFSQLGPDIDGEAAFDEIGHSVSLSADGSRLAAGAIRNDGNGNESGHVRIYDWNGTSWVQLGADIDGETTGDQSGIVISISADGSRVAIGGRRNDGNGNESGHVRIYEWNGSTWSQLGADIDGEAAFDESGFSVSLSANGSRLAIGARLNDGNGSNSGHVRIYEWNGITWAQLGADIDGEVALDESGFSASLSADGNRVAIGARVNDGNGPNSGHVRIYQWNGTSWAQLGTDIDGEAAGDQSGYLVSLSANGSRLAIGAIFNDGNGSNSGHVRIYEWNGSTWSQLGADVDGEAAFDQSGFGLSLSSNGSRLAVGARLNDGNGSNSGHVRIYDWNGTSWVQLGTDIDGEAVLDLNGFSVSLSSDGSRLAIGAVLNDGNGSDSGHVRVFMSPVQISCTNAVTDTLEVFALPTVTFEAPTDLCLDAGVQTGLGGGLPAGGVYSGPGVTDAADGATYSFDPAAAGVGTHTITYTFADTNTCGGVASDDIEIFAILTITFEAPTDLCLDAGVQTGLGGGLPAGGFYSGPGVTDAADGATYSFDPAAAGVDTHIITYAFEDSNACGGAASDNVEVFALPDITFEAPTDLCLDSGVQTGLGGGLPAGGFYSGAGVTDDGNGSTYSFDPAAAGVDTHIITYAFEDSNACGGAASDNVEVFALPTVTFTAPADLCIDADIQVNLGGAGPTGGTYSGPGVTDNGDGTFYSFDPGAAGEGIHTIAYTYTNSNGCTNDAKDDIQVIVCNLAPIAVCEALTIDADANCQADLVAADFDGGSTDPDGDPLTFTVSPAGPYPLGTTEVTLTVSDGVETDSCITSIIVVDNTPPVITCPAEITVDNDPGECGAVVTFADPTAMDGCTGVTTAVYGNSTGISGQDCIGQAPLVFTPINSGSITSITLFALTGVSETGSLIIQDEDPCGTPTILAISDVQSVITNEWITWNFPTPLAITAGTQYFITSDSICIGIALADGNDPTTDKVLQIGPTCNYSESDYAAQITVEEEVSLDINQTAGLPSGATFPIGTTTNTFEVTDSNGNTATCSFDVTVNDTQAPKIETEASPLIVECDGNGNIDEFQAWLDDNGGATASDLCGEVTWTNNCDNPWEGYLNVFDLDENLLYQDFASLPDLVTVIDNGTGSITLKPNRLSVYPYDDTWINPDGSGNRIIDAVTFANDDSLLGQPFSFNGNVSSNSLDPSYTSYAFIRIFVADFSSVTEFTAPLSAGPFSIETDGSVAPPGGHVQYGFVVRGVNVNLDASYDATYDALGSIQVQAAECVITDACGATGSRTVTFTATDASGLTATTTATFTIGDNTPPVIDEHAQDQTVSCATGNVLTEVSADIDAILALSEGEDDISHLVNLGQPEGVSTVDWLVELEEGQTLEIGQPFVPGSGESVCTTLIEQSNLTSFYTDANPIYASAGQSFTIPPGETEISGIIAHFGFIADQANITLNLYEGPASGTIGTPISSVSYTGPVGGVTAPPGSDIPIEFTFNAPVTVIPGNIYYYLVSPSFDPVAFSYAFANNDPYTEGSALSGLSDGTVSGWPYDLKFSVLSCSEEGGGTEEGDEILYTRVDYFDTNTGAPVPAGQVSPYISETYSDISDIEDPFFPGQGLFPARKLELTVINADENEDLEWKYTIRCLIVRNGVAIQKYFYVDPKIRIKSRSAVIERDGENESYSVEASFDDWLANNGGAQASDACGEVTWSNDFTGFTDGCGETGSATVTFTAMDACGLMASTTATFTIVSEPVSVNGPENVDATVCEYADQEALTLAYTNWLAEFDIAAAGCSATGDFATVPPSAVVYNTEINIELTFSATDECSTDSITASFVVSTAPDAPTGEDTVVVCQDVNGEPDYEYTYDGFGWTGSYQPDFDRSYPYISIGRADASGTPIEGSVTIMGVGKDDLCLPGDTPIDNPSTVDGVGAELPDGRSLKIVNISNENVSIKYWDLGIGILDPEGYECACSGTGVPDVILAPGETITVLRTGEVIEQVTGGSGGATETITATATAPVGSSVVWYDAETGGNEVATPEQVGAGTIMYWAASVDDQTGCESTTRFKVTLTVNDKPGPEVTNAAICKDDSYTWPVNGVTYTEPSYVTIANDDCEADQHLVLLVKRPVRITSTQEDVVCFGGPTGSIDITVNDGVGNYTYAWSGPDNFSATTEDLSGLAAGVYDVTVTDEIGCESTAQVTVELTCSTVLSVTGIELIDADNDISLGPLTDGMVIDVSTLPTLNLTIEALTTDDVESVQLTLSEAMSHTQNENNAPYMLYGDNVVDYYGDIFVLGNYTITATPYSANGLGGTQGTPRTLSFTLIDTPIDNDGDGFAAGVDCDDNDPNVFPGAIEVCDGIDNNCDGQIDEGLTTTYYADTDGDGYGDPFSEIELCGPQAGYVTDNTDCNDTNAGVNTDALEICDGIDNNCDGQIDEGFVTETYYADLDGDGFGDPNNSVTICDQPAGFVTDNTDCDDTNTNINPDSVWYLDADGDDFAAATLKQCTDPGADYTLTILPISDCNDNDAGINPNATEVCDGVDNNCDGLVDDDEPGVTCSSVLSVTGIELIDADNDVSLGPLTDGMVIDINTLSTLNLTIEALTTDDVESVQLTLSGAMSHTQNENNAPYMLYGDNVVDYYGDIFVLGNYTITATPYSANGLGGTQGTPRTLSFTLIDTPIDNDGDGFVAGVDCDDNDPNVFPGAIEVCDGIDNNCDGNIDEGLTTTYYADTDGDGYGDPSGEIQLCGPQAGYVTDNTDCNDNNAAINPGALEICDGIDNNCDGNIDEGFVTENYYADLDGDGFGDPASVLQGCSQPIGYVLDNTDCNDNDTSVNPSALEICDGIDNNCDGLVDGDEPGVTCSTVLSVTGIELIDADNDVSLGPLTDGMVIDINTLPTLNLTIEALTTEDVESVQLTLSGAMSHTQNENNFPYLLYGDNVVDYYGDIFVLGSYTITATPYSANGLGGTQGTPKVVNFELVDGGPLRNAPDQDASIHDLIKVLAWPNPSESSFNLELVSEAELGNVKISVFDSSHKLIHTGAFDSKGMYAFGANFVSGVYTVKLVHAKGVETVRIIKE